MKHLTLLLIGAVICIGIYFSQNNNDTPMYRIPTNGTIVHSNQSEEEDNANRREQYFESMHRTAPGTDWRAIDRKTRKQQYEAKLNDRLLKTPVNIESFGNGAIQGEWFERGSKDQSGSIRAMDYDVDTDKIYLISDGGTVWKGSRTGNDWTPQNEDLQFDRNFIKVVDNGNGGKRLLTSINKIVHYSDDEGLSWQFASGFDFYNDSGNSHSMCVLNDAYNTIYYLALTYDDVSFADRMWLFRSIDNGQTFERIHVFPHGDSKQISMWSPFNSSELYILDKSTTLYDVVGSSVNVLNANMNLPNNSEIQLRGHKSNTTLTLYTLVNRKDIYRSTNNGAWWNFQGTLPANAWDVGIDVSLNDANRLYSGDLEAQRSFNGGASWTKANIWWEYYNDVYGKIHADIMAFGSFYDQTGAPFTLTANHGGISISYDNLVTNTNIALQNLNVSQYYDVVTSEADLNYMYAGTQDQGVQRTNMAADTTIANWEQVDPGDYGHLVFSDYGQSLWTQYVAGKMDYYHFPSTGYANASWEMTGTELPSYGFLLPSAETADYTDNSMYIGGGNLNGGSGNYLIKLTYFGGYITATQGNYDFKANASGGSISAIEASKIDANRLYVATDNGTFFYSNDNGTSWSKTPYLPSNWYLYGASILASDVTSDVVYYGGSGYSSPAVYKSTDGGVSFMPMNNGLPNTLVHELAANTDESLLFAATEVGPYVYVAAQDQWFDMRGLGAPMQRYTSVEYIDSEEIVRFGTYGRGAWDFKVLDCGAPANLAINIKVYLEGAYDPTFDEMTSDLSDRKLLPGQTPLSPIASPTPPGQPYNIAPWNYLGQEGMNWSDNNYTGNEVDWVLVTFRTGIESSTEIAKTAAILMSDGTLEFPNRCILDYSMPFPLYVVIEHRNHMGIMSAAPIDIDATGQFSYDFRVQDSYSGEGFGQKMVGNYWCMYAGDSNQLNHTSYDITGNDKSDWMESNGNFDRYTSGDYNLNGDINGDDKLIWSVNNGISSRVPK